MGNVSIWIGRMETMDQRKKLLGIFLFSFLILFLRRPDILLSANFWAEDGVVWYTQLHNNGWISLFQPQNGYFQTISRLTMMFSAIFGILHAPLISNLCSLIIRILPILFLFSTRFPFVKEKTKIVIALYYLLMPNLAEVFGNITNVHWFISLYLLLVLLAEQSDLLSWKVHDMMVLAIAGLSGPFIVCLLPGLLIKRLYEYREQKKLTMTSFDLLFIFLLLLQGTAICLTMTEGRSTAPLGASFTELAKIVDSKILLGTFITNKFGFALFSVHNRLALLLFCSFLVVFMFSFVRGGWRFKTAAVFPIFMLAAALAKPMVSLTDPQWPVLLLPSSGDRYFIVTNVLFFCFVVYLFNQHLARLPFFNGRLIKKVALIVFLALVIDAFHISSLPNHAYQEEIKERYYPAQVGTMVEVPINPVGWTMVLRRK